MDKCCEVLFMVLFCNANTALAEINSNTMRVGDFNTQLTSMDRSLRQKINNEIMALNTTLDQFDFIDIYTVFHPKPAGYTFFSSAHGTFCRIGHILVQKASLNKF